ncbi:Protein of unknown function [Streptococcus thermophilus]|nr:Protein of unknown function [Streptococcus thermophilus]
MLTKTFMK